jgi:tetrahydromethanopterin S-methyltransferase subunit F
MKTPTVFALVTMASGLISAYLLDRERRDAEGLAVARLTGWFWLGLFSSLAVVISALMFYLKRSKPT